MRPVHSAAANIFLTLLGFSSVGWSAATLTGDPVDCVNPLSGANGDSEFSRGNAVVAIVAPFDMSRRPFK